MKKQRRDTHIPAYLLIHAYPYDFLFPSSPVLRLTADLRGELSDGDSIRINKDEEFVVGKPWDMTMLTMSHAWNLPTANGLPACKRVQAGREPKMSCCLTLVMGDERAFSACDLRAEVKAGDTIKIRTEVFIVREPMDAKSFSLE